MNGNCLWPQQPAEDVLRENQKVKDTRIRKTLKQITLYISGLLCSRKQIQINILPNKQQNGDSNYMQRPWKLRRQNRHDGVGKVDGPAIKSCSKCPAAIGRGKAEHLRHHR